MNGMAPTAQQACSKQDIRKTATGYASDTVCTVAGRSVTSHSDVVGDFNSAYTVTTVSHSEGGPAGARDTTSKLEAEMDRRLQAGPEARRRRDAGRPQDQCPGDARTSGAGRRIWVN